MTHPPHAQVHRVWRQHCGATAVTTMPLPAESYNIYRLPFFAVVSSRISACCHDSIIAAPLSTVRVSKFEAIRTSQKSMLKCALSDGQSFQPPSCRRLHCGDFPDCHDREPIVFCNNRTFTFISVRDAMMSHYCRPTEHHLHVEVGSHK